MKYILIASEAHTMPYAIEIDGPVVSTAMEEGKNNFTPMFLIDVEGKIVKRVIRSEDEFVLVDEAFNQKIGRNTPDEWFEEQE